MHTNVLPRDADSSYNCVLNTLPYHLQMTFALHSEEAAQEAFAKEA